MHTNTMTVETVDADSIKSITASVILGTVGASTILVMPGLLGVIVAALGLSEQQLGFVASVDIFTMAIAMGISAVGVSRLNWRLLALIGLLILAAGNMGSLLSSNYSAILWARGVAGIGEGITVAVSFAALGATSNPDRSFGIYLVFALIFSALVLFAMPSIFAFGGYELVFGLLIGLCLANILFLPWMTAKPNIESHSGEFEQDSIPYLLAGIGFVVVTLFFIAQGAIWSYLERIGLAADLPVQTIGGALALSALAGIAGAGVATLLGDRIGRFAPISFGVLVQVFSMFFLTIEPGVFLFISAVMMFNFGWNLCQPYFSGIMAELDPRGRVVVMMGSIQTIGVAAGPFLAAMIIQPGQFDAISYLGIGCVVASLLFTYLLLTLWKSSRQPLVVPIINKEPS